jgi:hypothetical protein
MPLPKMGKALAFKTTEVFSADFAFALGTSVRVLAEMP